MEDAPTPTSVPLSLPDDPAALKALIADLTGEREQRIAERARILAEREQLRRKMAAGRERLAVVEQQNLKLEEDREQLKLKLLLVQHQLDLLKRRYYGPRADHADLGQFLLDFAGDLEGRAVDPADLPPSPDPANIDPVGIDPVGIDPVGIRRVRRGRRNLAAFNNLPVTRHTHDLSEADKPCPCCGMMREKIGEESSWQLEYIPGRFERLEHLRVKYACKRCEADAQNPRIVLADKPVQPVEKGMAGPGLLAWIVTGKYADHLPLYRLEGIFERSGFEIDRSTQCVWMGDVARIVRPLYDRMVGRVLGSHVIHTDDTVLPMLAPDKTRQARVWVYTGDPTGPYNVFDFTLSRGRDGPARFLGDYNQVLVADAYGGYDGICIEKQITQAGCWAHARRKFVDARPLEPAITREALALIGQLFGIEQRARELSPADRLCLRKSEAQAVLDRLENRLAAWTSALLPRHPVAAAVGYVRNQWKPLTAFMADGAIPIDNNTAEREMKRIALGRKNYLFVGNQRGGETAAILSSLTSTCRRHDIDPQRYLTQLLANLPSTPISRLDEWLPDQWKSRQQAEGGV